MKRSDLIASVKDALKPRYRWLTFCYLTRLVGFFTAARYFFNGFGGREKEYWFQPKGAKHPLCVRRNSSDILVLGQIFVEKEYEFLNRLKDVKLILDCGANAGFSSLYFMEQHPRCHVVAVEPDRGNFAQMVRNLKPYEARVKLIHAGIWSSTARLAIAEGRYRDGREWSKQVRVCSPEDADGFDGVDVGSILQSSGFARISLLKMDIEGAEAVVFSENYTSWLDRVDNIAIELHADSMFGNGREVFFKAIEGQGFQCSQQGDLTLCVRPEADKTVTAQPFSKAFC